MRTHTQAFKEQIKELGREIDSRITYGSNVITSEELFSVSPVVNGSILKSSMKQLDFESSVQLPLNAVLEYQFGLKVNGEYEYLNYGDFIVYSIEYNEDMKSWSYVCYDSMLFTMKEYTKLQNGTFPMTVREYLTNLCLDCGLVFKNANDEFANYDKVIPNDLYANLGYTYRDILDELSQVTASTICSGDNNQVEIRYITETNDSIDEEYLKAINVKFGEKYGPINSIVLSRSAESDNVYLQDEDSVASNGLCELKIIDNQIMNDNNRSDYLPDILDKLNGLEYFTNDYSSTGILYYELCDRYNVQIGGNTYSCVLFNDEPKITQGLIENIYTELPNESETDYTKSDKTDRKINQTYLMVDKQNQKISALSSQVVDTTKTATGIGTVIIDGQVDNAGYQLTITDACQIFPSPKLYPSAMLYPLGSWLKVTYEDGTYSRCQLPVLALRKLNDVYDEMIITSGKVQVIKRIGITFDESLYLLNEPIITTKEDVEIIFKKGINKVELESFPNANLKMQYMIESIYSNTFSTKKETSAEIKLASDTINIAVAQKVDDKDFTGANIMLLVNSDESEAQINADKINLKGKEINLTSDEMSIKSDNFSVDKEGNMVCNNAVVNGEVNSQKGDIGGWSISSSGLTNGTVFLNSDGSSTIYTVADLIIVRGYIMETPGFELSAAMIEHYDLDNDGVVTSADYVILQNLIGMSMN